MTSMVHEKNLKKQDIQNASLAGIFESMSKSLLLFCEIWVFTPSVLGTPLMSHHLIFSPQIMQESWLTYCFIQRQNYLCDKLGF